MTITDLTAIQENGKTVFTDTSGRQYRATGSLGNTDTAPAITAESVPDEPKNWGCSEWVDWHKRLKERHGQARANDLWLSAWNQQGFWDVTSQLCQYHCPTQRYFVENGIDSDGLAKLACGLDKVVGSTGDILTSTGAGVQNVGKGVENLTKGALNTTGVLKIAVPVLLLAILGGLGYYGYKNYIKGNKKLPSVLPGKALLSEVKKKLKK